MAAIKEDLSKKWEKKVSDLAEETGYPFEYLWGIWLEELMEENGKTEEKKWDYFRGVSIEHDW